ncbi:hypothetical protein C0J56_05870 [Pseudomonas fluorescens]|nr:hypothetical protein C0J56_05870 [Pseudomonas fluorescens]
MAGLGAASQPNGDKSPRHNGPDTAITPTLDERADPLGRFHTMLNDFAFDQDGSRRHVALGVAQMIELGMLLANKCLDRVELRT